VSAADLLAMKFEPEQWIVGDLLRVDSKRISLLAGYPHDGKSTLAMQMCVAVTKGIRFLGRDTLRSSAILWQSEAELRKVAASLQALGYNPHTDEELLVLNSSAGENNLDALRRELIAHPEVRVVVIETLDDLLRIADLNKNTAAREAFERFDTKILNDFSHRCAFLALHHMNKEKRDRKGHMLMGATVIGGKTDAVWYLQRQSDDDEVRVFETVNRSGRHIPPTYLKFNKDTQTNTLDKTIAEAKKEAREQTGDKIKEAILNFFSLHPDSSFEKDCLNVIEGASSDAKRRIFKSLLADGSISKHGRGTKNSPYVFRLAESRIPTEERKEAGVTA